MVPLLLAKAPMCDGASVSVKGAGGLAWILLDREKDVSFDGCKT
jgi:hypothetical protein